MSLDLSAAITTFVFEANELLQSIENELVECESSELSAVDINKLFRAIHTIKGSAGIFAFRHVAELSHAGESFLDKIRDSKTVFPVNEIPDLLRLCDLLKKLIDDAANKVESSEFLKNQAAMLATKFEQKEIPELAKLPSQQCSGAGLNQHWFVYFAPHKNVLINGLEPLNFLKYVQKQIPGLKIKGYLPESASIQTYNPEENHLSFFISVPSLIKEGVLNSLFEFMKNDAELAFIPPQAEPSQWQSLTHKLDKELLTNLLSYFEDQNIAVHIAKQVFPIMSTKNDHVKYQHTSLRVEAKKLDELINQVGEMVITGARTNLLAHQTGDENLIESMAMLERLVENIRDSSLKLRMVQINETFNVFKRAARDMAKELDKKVKLEIEGADTELDKTFVEKVTDPIMHIIRNAIDHGIEAPELRRALGKPEHGKLILKAYHDSGSICIEIMDDGQGIDPEKIQLKASSLGYISAGTSLTKKETTALIFEPGFSTASSVTSLSGRGVGMDVVKQNIESLRGTVDVTSERGQGTKVSIRLPLTLSIIDGFMFNVNQQYFVIPLDTVVECLELHEVVAEAEIIDKNYIKLRDEVLPFIRLRKLFGNLEKQAHNRESLVVVQFGSLRAGLVVDNLQGEFQTVVKPLGKLFEGLKCISGATILGSGNVAIILDVAALIRSAISEYESRQTVC